MDTITAVGTPDPDGADQQHPSACRFCGVLKGSHGYRINHSTLGGNHYFEEPTMEQRKARIMAISETRKRRQAEAEAKALNDNLTTVAKVLNEPKQKMHRALNELLNS